MNKKFKTLGILLAISFFATQLGSHEARALDSSEFDKAMDAYLTNEDNVEKVGSALEKYFQKKRDKQRKQASVDEEKKMEEQFKNPVKIDIAGSPVKGKPDAKVTVIEFSDFECPFCKRGMDVMEDLLKAYPNDVKVVFKHLPLPFHKNAKPASRAALAAGEQGKFWEMHEQLFNNQKNLNMDGFVSMAEQIELDVEKFKKDYETNAAKYDKMIDEDAALATKLGVRGTPGFFVNGVQVRGAQPLPKFKQLVDRWLEMDKKS